MLLWIAAALIVLGLALFAFSGRIRNTFGSFRGNLAQNVRGNVQQGYTEAACPAPAEQPAAGGEDRFIKWAGLAIALVGAALAAFRMWIGK
jgi:hypothetical protein